MSSSIIDEIVPRRNNQICKEVHRESAFQSDYGILYKTEKNQEDCFDLYELNDVPKAHRTTDPVFCCTDTGKVNRTSLGNKIQSFCNNPVKSDEATAACSSYLQDYLPEDECRIVNDQRFVNLLSLLTKLVKFIYVVRYRCAGVAHGCEVNQYDALLVLATSQINHGFADEEIRCVKYPYKTKVNPFSNIQNLVDFFNFSKDIMNLAIKSTDGLSAWTTEYSSHRPDARDYASDFQPWARLLSQFVKSYTEKNVPDIAKTRLYLPFIKNEMKSYMDFFETNIKDVFLVDTDSKNIIDAQIRLIQFLTKPLPESSLNLPSRSKTGGRITRRRRHVRKSKSQKRR